MPVVDTAGKPDPMRQGIVFLDTELEGTNLKWFQVNRGNVENEFLKAWTNVNSDAISNFSNGGTENNRGWPSSQQTVTQLMPCIKLKTLMKML